MYYAGRGNLFWPTLFEVGLTPVLLAPETADELPRFGIGLTDLAKEASGSDRELPPGAFAPARLAAVLGTWRPTIVAFNGKRAARAALGRPAAHPVDYGEQAGLEIGGAVPWVLPSTSGAARGYWSIEPWRRLAEAVRARRA